MWAKLDDSLLDHIKLLRAADYIGKNGEALALAAFSGGLLYCARNLTDGFIPLRVVAKGGAFSDQPLKVAESLVSATLWHKVEGGYRVHDYEDWNPSSTEVKARREWDRRRKLLYADADLVRRVRERDQDRCRYCRIEVNWKDRRGPHGGQFDHVVPRGPNTFENVVVACRGCNNRKGDRTPEQAGMVLSKVV
jgi:5-methylcytosine-specific restriction endonuclease McrA